jgi:hypothetical protein
VQITGSSTLSLSSSSVSKTEGFRVSTSSSSFTGNVVYGSTASSSGNLLLLRHTTLGDVLKVRWAGRLIGVTLSALQRNNAMSRRWVLEELRRRHMAFRWRPAGPSSRATRRSRDPLQLPAPSQRQTTLRCGGCMRLTPCRCSVAEVVNIAQVTGNKLTVTSPSSAIASESVLAAQASLAGFTGNLIYGSSGSTSGNLLLLQRGTSVFQVRAVAARCECAVVNMLLRCTLLDRCPQVE